VEQDGQPLPAAGTFSKYDHTWYVMLLAEQDGHPLPQLRNLFLNMTTLILVLTHTFYMMIKAEQDGQPQLPSPF
jgi:hypothetical protein